MTTPNAEAVDIEDRIELAHKTMRLSFLSLVFTGFAIALLSIPLYFEKEPFASNFRIMPQWVLLTVIVAITTTGGLRVYDLSLLLFVPLQLTTHPEVLKISMRNSIMNIITMVLCIAVLLYVTGIVSLLFYFMQNTMFPQLAKSVSYFLSNVVSWILSGVIGNFVYDLLKRLYTRKKEKG